MEDLYQYDHEFRDSISTVDKEGKRIWVYPKEPKGHFTNLRVYVAVLLLGLLFSGPFIKIDGHPFILVNIFERKFILFGVAFWPQDFHILALILIAFVIFIVLFTVVFGRIWCGWACPQTIFMEMVFRKIEYWIDGDAIQQRKLKQAPWNTVKVTKRALKYGIFLIISLLIAHTVMAYLIGIDRTIEIVSQSPSEHLAGFMGLLAFTGIFMFVFSYFREQACIVVCPYGRLQGVFLTNSSIAVMYDWLRGEPRGKLKKNGVVDTTKGDCIDCKMCVHVCPTGIDIRNGTQLECVNCTACIDACDDIMTRINKPKGLIRYASHNSVKDGVQKLFNARVVAYSFILAILLISIIILLSTRTDIETTVLRVPGQLYQKEENGNISNLYNIQFINKTFEEVTLDLSVKGVNNAVIRRVGGDKIVIPPSEGVDGVFFIELPASMVTKSKTGIVLEISTEGKLMDEVKTNFLGPF